MNDQVKVLAAALSHDALNADSLSRRKPNFSPMSRRSGCFLRMETIVLLAFLVTSVTLL